MGRDLKMFGRQVDELFSSFLSLRKKFWNTHQGLTNLEFGCAIADFLRKLNHLKIICDRIEEGEVMRKSEREKGIKYGILPDDRNTDILILDREDFFIHGRMLLDRVAYLTHFFFSRKVLPLYSSFKKYRNFFLKPDNIPWSPDEEYARYIRERTEWFEKDLKDPRDDLIVHTKGKGEFLGLGEDTIEWHRVGILSRYRKKLRNLFKKYNIPLPDLTVQGAPIETALEILEKHKSRFQSKDKKSLKQIKQQVGGKLPDINSLFRKILAFLEFFEKHFSQTLDQSQTN